MIEKTITLQIFTDDENIANEFLYNLIKIHNSQYHEINCVEWKIKDQVKVELSEKFPVVKQLWEESEEEFKKALKLIWGFRTDWEKPARAKDVFISNVTKNLTPGSIILIHEHPWSLSNLDALLSTLDSLGYTYVDPNNIVE